MPHSYGHDVLSDWADKADDDPVFGIFKQCGMWTIDEAAILYNIAKQVGGAWVDIGSHTGWTAAHLLSAGCWRVAAVDPMYKVQEFAKRALDNLKTPTGALGYVLLCDTKSDRFFASPPVPAPGFSLIDQGYNGVVIDGDHDTPHPLQDAQNAHKYLAADGVILLHDAIGEPVQEGVLWLIDHGYKCKVYSTPHVVACCWRGDFVPPEHVPDPFVASSVRQYLGGLAEYAN